MKALSTVILIFTVVIAAYGQRFNFKNYSLEDGLPRSGVYSIIQDDAGFLWIGTEGGGICKFDGFTFKSYTKIHGLPDENIRVIFEDNSGIIWMGTTEGLCYFNGIEFETITAKDGLADNYVRSITQDFEGNIWVGTDKGISIIDPDEKHVSDKLKFNLSLPDKRVRSLLAQHDVIWIGTDGGLCEYKNGEIKVYSRDNGLSSNRILDLYLDSKMALWIGTENGINRFFEGKFTYWTEEDGLISNRVRTITEDVHGNIWIGTSHGLSIFDEGKFTNITSRNGLSNDRIRCLMTDSFGNVWIGTFFGGVMRFNYRDFAGIKDWQGLASNQVSAINEDIKGNIIVGTYEGPTRLSFENKILTRHENIKLSNLGEGNSVHTIYRDHNDFLWFGTSFGTVILDTADNIVVGEQFRYIYDHVTDIEYYNGKYWVGTLRGLAHIEVSDDYQNYEVKYMNSHNGLAGDDVSDIEIDSRGLIWISFSDGKVTIFDKDKLINPKLPENAKEILTMEIDSADNVWFGTNGNGIYYGPYDPKNKTLLLENITTTADLSSNYIFSILIKNGEIWAGHEKGIDNLTRLTDSSFSIRTFGPERGFEGLQNNQNASFIDSKGNLWFGTLSGLYYLNETELSHTSEIHNSIAYIKKIEVNGISVNWSESEWCEGTSGVFNLPVNLKLPFNQNNIAFDFVALNYVSPSKLRYSWKLEGFEENWNLPSNKNYVSYTNLESGTYTFLLKSSDEYGVIQGDPIAFTFKVSKPFWETWLFRVTAVVMGFIIWILFTRARTAQMRRKQKALEAVIEDRTQEVRKQNQQLEYKQKEIEASNLALQEKNQEITDSILYSRRIQSSIMPSREKTNSILGRHFILYRPKDIVSGDFYWVEHSPSKKGLGFFAVADCTGHGVPGAMVSLIGTRALNASLLQHNLEKCNEILEMTNDIMIAAFTDAESGEIIKDGMDITLCGLDYTDRNNIQFQYSGAQNPVWIVRRASEDNLILNGEEMKASMKLDGHELFEIKATKQPIGHFENRVPFVNNECSLKEGDRIYLFSDGFADQFGGDRGKKFKYKSLKELVLKHQDLEIEDQYKKIKDAFYNWKQDMEQIDDVCVMGVEV